eukprot:SM007238S21503  [mRNA]  locus=s7238:3:717:- [translate_table: standard]
MCLPASFLSKPLRRLPPTSQVGHSAEPRRAARAPAAGLRRRFGRERRPAGRHASADRDPAAAAAFASILFAPRGLSTFGRNLQRIAERSLPACLVYGGDDPWIGPLWGARAKRAMPAAAYYELSPAGHCPHHEVPEVVNELLREWMHATLTGGPPPLHEERQRTWALPPRKSAAAG